MIDFNSDWDEPDIWSTPTHSPLSISQVPPATEQDLSPGLKAESSTSLATSTLEPSWSTSATTSPTDSKQSFDTVQRVLPDELSNSDRGSNTPVASERSTNVESYLQSPPKFSITSELEPSSVDPKFSPSPPPPSSWSNFFQDSANINPVSSQDLFSSSSSPSFDSSVGFEDFNSHTAYNNAPEDLNDEDEFGDFDDGEMTVGDDNFGGFTTPSPFPPALRSTPIVPVKLPDQFTEEALRDALGPPLKALFENFPSHSDSSQAWLEAPRQSSQKKKTGHSSSTSRQMPSILKSDDLQGTLQKLVSGGNRLGRPVEWKRSQIRRLHLVHLGIPVDLNDFLAPAPMARNSLAIDTKCTTSNLTGNLMRQSPTVSSPFRGPMLDRKRCEELAGLSEASLCTKDIKQLGSTCEELKRLNQQALDTLALKQQQRDRSIQDCQAYNTMISDLVLAAQKIQMASPGSTKRASSINLGSSSISSSTRWIPLTRSNSHRHSESVANVAPQPGPPGASVVGPSDSSV